VNEDNIDDDGDTFPDDGCLHIPDPCGGVDYDGDTTVTLADTATAQRMRDAAPQPS
jgi:hypothetical protein